MTNLLNSRARSTAMLLAAITLAVHAGAAGAFASPAIAIHTTAAVAGFGFWETLSCIACIAGFVIGAGTTIAGLAAFLAAHPEIAILCVSTCAAAAS
jgi:hypothetical protein